MPMYDVIELIDIKHELNNGHYTDRELSRTVYCEVKSVTRSEFYQSYQAGLNASLVFIILSAEVGAAEFCVWRGRRYKILRQYLRLDDYSELTCAEVK